MPWCEPCERYYNPNALAADGSCPSCGRDVAAQEADPGDDTPAAMAHEHRAEALDADGKQAKVPWHFWLLLVAVIGYLGWRAVEGIVWLIGQL